MSVNYKELFEKIMKRYGETNPVAIEKVLCPILIPIHKIDKEIIKLPEQKHYRATFWIRLNKFNEVVVQRGRTGKFVPKSYVENGGVWHEIAKGRIISVDFKNSLAEGEIYTSAGSKKDALEEALEELSVGDYLEIDQYGAAAKVLSGLVEHSLVDIALTCGYTVRRMSEDLAKHLGDYYHYDFEFGRGGVIKKIEVKSLWGTDTRFARLIHSKSNTYKTSSCKFETQDIFAVNLFLRTGNIRDFAFARSVSNKDKTYGLPPHSQYSEYVNQNPLCTVGDGVWFATIDEVWELD